MIGLARTYLEQRQNVVGVLLQPIGVPAYQQGEGIVDGGVVRQRGSEERHQLRQDHPFLHAYLAGDRANLRGKSDEMVARNLLGEAEAGKTQ